MTVLTMESHIVKDKDICGGQPRIEGTRIKIEHIIMEYEGLGWSPDKICDAHPKLSLSDVYAAITYYYENKKEIDENIQKDKEFVNQLRKMI